VAPPDSELNGAPHLRAGDFWPFVEALGRRWGWLFLGGATLGLAGLWIGRSLWQSSYTAPAQLIRYDSPNVAEVFGFRPAAPQTFASLLRSPELLRRVGAKASPPISGDALASALRVMPERNSDIIVAAVSGPDPQAAVDLANLYANEAVRFTQELQAKSAAEIRQFATQQLAHVEAEIAALNDRPRGQPASAPLAVNVPRPTALAEKLQAARDELVDLLARYTEAHPLVQAHQAKLAALERQLAEKPSDASLGVTPVPGGSPLSDAMEHVARLSEGTDPELLRGKLQSLENSRLTLLGRLRAAQSLEENPPGYYQLLAAAAPKDLVKFGRKPKVLFLTALAGLFGVLGAAAAILIVEFMDDRLKSAVDVTRVSKLPVLAAAGDFAQMTYAEQDTWAFRAWTSLQGRLSSSPNRGLVCGITSTGHGDGRSTWVNLLARAASERGFRVLTIDTHPANGNGPDAVDRTSGAPSARHAPASAGSTALATNLLTSPGEVTRKLTGPDSQPVVHIPLPGWVWDLERRKQWQAALRQWSQIDNIVILVELPPAGEAEAVLLAENLPNLVWLSDSGKATATETRAQLETLRHARCRLAGVVLNHAPSGLLHGRFQRWLNFALAIGMVNISLAHAVEADPNSAGATDQPAETNLTFSVVSPVKRAPWQARLTLGAGDILNFALFGEAELARADVPIGPDGRVSFLEAQDIPAAGVTIDELRTRIDAELAKYRRAPRTIITPVAFHSKKYIMLGGIAQKGVFTLDRPITVIEAVARARGLETGLSDRTTVEVADLSRSFLARGGKRAAVDFAKLFQAGDLSQNIPLEPDDYLYFPVGAPKEVYVLGEVNFPGTISFSPGISALGAISLRGGFNPRAWKKRVLIVRGSLNRPQTFIVDAADVLAARHADFKLEATDIIYVSHRPWIKAEELLDAAASAFVQSAVITWTGLHAGPLIK
jgi:protein involved in polysaccharide export with SLBB domain/capsular polysaccharide biosynthesis protein